MLNFVAAENENPVVFNNIAVRTRFTTTTTITRIGKQIKIDMY